MDSHSHTHTLISSLSIELIARPVINAAPPSAVHAGAQAIAAGGYHSMVLKADGTVWAAGGNGYGQLGDGTQDDKSNFVQVFSGQ